MPVTDRCPSVPVNDRCPPAKLVHLHDDPTPDAEPTREPTPEPTQGVSSSGVSSSTTSVATPPPSGPPSKAARNVVVGLLIAFVVASNLGNLFLSVLVTERPLLFIGLNAQNRNLALASGELSAWSFYLVGFLRLIGPDPLFFLLGRWYGDGAIRWMERKAPTYGELLRQLETWFHKARIPVVAIAPNNPVCLFAGAAGMSWGMFLAANAFGTAVRLVLIRAFSSAFEGPLGSLREFIADYRWYVLAFSFVMVGLTIWSDRRGGRESIGDLMNIEATIAEAEAETDPTS